MPKTEPSAPVAGVRREPGFKAQILHARLRGHGQMNWVTRLEEAQRLEAVLGTDPFFIFEDVRGATVCLNTAFVQMGRALRGSDGQCSRWEPPKGVRVRLAGCEVVEIGAAEPGEVQLALLLEGPVEEYVRWLDENGELVMLRVADIVFLEYPSEWDFDAV